MHQSKKELNLKHWNQLVSLDLKDKIVKDEMITDHQLSREIDSIMGINMRNGRAT